MTLRRLVVFALLALSVGVPTASAHAGDLGAVETRIALPPWLVWFTGASVVALSFAVVGAFLTRPLAPPAAASPEPRDADDRATAPRAAALAVLLLGAANAVVPTPGVLPSTILWLVVVGVLPALAYLVGGWERANPFRLLGGFARRLRGRRTPLPYPRRWGAWPAFAVLFALLAFEVSGNPAAGNDGAVATLLAAYLLATFLGLLLFGTEAWLANGEALSVALRWWSAFAPIATARGWRRDPGLAARASDVALVVLLLFTVNADGFLATPIGRSALDALDGSVGAGPALVSLLVVGYLAFLGAFVGAVFGIRAMAGSLDPIGTLAARFAPALLPVAVAYHAAHTFPTLAEQAPRLLVAALDPLGAGWAATLPVSWTLPSSTLTGLGVAQVLLIVAGHVLAVAVAHRLAFVEFASRVQAIRSELPLTAIMVFYTLVGLGVLSASGGGA